MKKQISFRMVAYTDAAGKYTEGACRNGNEDNFYVDDNLADEDPSHCSPDEITRLSECGMLMAVADGMGGMNAGEIASQIATDTVKRYFYPGKIDAETASNAKNRGKYLEDVIKAADRNIKDDARQNPEHEGMGSTIILAWMVGNELTVSWCGDSRAYRFNPLNGIELLSRDHSYVQELVNKGVLTYDQIFEHPQGNIVTRSLGDPGKEAKPETRQFNVYKEDVILLCSDGLSGVLRDRKTYDEAGNLLPGENLEDIISDNLTSMKACRQALWEAAEQADWYDNVTAILCQITDGAPDAIKAPKPSFPHANRAQASDGHEFQSPAPFWKKKVGMKLFIGTVGLLLATNIATFLLLNHPSTIKQAVEQENLKKITDEAALDSKLIEKRNILKEFINTLRIDDNTKASLIDTIDTAQTTEDLVLIERQAKGLQEKQEEVNEETQPGTRNQGAGDAERTRARNAGRPDPGNSRAAGTEQVNEPATSAKASAAETGNRETQLTPTQPELTTTQPAASAVETTATPAPQKAEVDNKSNPKKHKVKKGETLYNIADKEHVSVDDIKKANNLKDNNIQKDQELIIPQKK